MHEKKNQEKTKPLPEFEKEITEILVANGRSFQPFIRTFSYSGENISKVNLGSLVGVFEIEEQSEDSAYIVNFLASVAKKEYFNNPRRGAIESFEAALHKVNLALAELVKHGNVAWLGKFHGALAVLEKNHFHFSVTGKAQILLFRNQALSDISEGLASEESNTHPIKTFVEVSSGRLVENDRILVTSPDLFSLFSFGEIEKNASRMDKDRFSQFLKTALRNELDISGTLIIDIRQGISRSEGKKEKKKAEGVPTLHNVFSQAAFDAKQKKTTESAPEASPHEEKPSEEYIDSKTGHIYVQGDMPENSSQSPFMESLSNTLQDVGNASIRFLSSQSKWLRKGKKQGLIAFDSLSELLQIVMRKAYRIVRKQLKKGISGVKRAYEEKKKGRESAKVFPTIETPTRESEESLDMEAPSEVKYQQEDQPLPQEETDEIPLFLRERLEKFYRKENQNQETPVRPEIRATPPEPLLKKTKEVIRDIFSLSLRMISFIRKSLTILWRNFSKLYGGFSRLQKKIFLGALAGIILILFIGVFVFQKLSAPKQESNTVSNMEIAATPEVRSLQGEKNVFPTASPALLANSQGPLVVPIILDNETYVVTTHGIFHPRTNKNYSLPSQSIIRLASAMDDLRLIFLLTEDNHIYAWSPINNSFTENTISLPSDARIQSIGTYLTYLYALDSTTDQIYRFPRADSGFGQSSTWLKDFLSIEDNSKMAVNETIFVSPTPSSINAYFRGRLTRSLESPVNTLSLIDLYSHPGLANTYALDSESKRVLVWNQDGNLIAQYTSDIFSKGKRISVNERSHEIFLTTNDDILLSFKLER